MVGLSLRGMGGLMALAGVVLGLLALHSGLLSAFGPTWALAGTSAATLVLASALWITAALLERYRKRHALHQIQDLLANHPVAGLASAVFVGALTRLGFDMTQLTRLLKAVLGSPKRARRRPHSKKEQPK